MPGDEAVLAIRLTGVSTTTPERVTVKNVATGELGYGTIPPADPLKTRRKSVLDELSLPGGVSVQYALVENGWGGWSRTSANACRLGSCASPSEDREASETAGCLKTQFRRLLLYPLSYSPKGGVSTPKDTCQSCLGWRPVLSGLDAAK